MMHAIRRSAIATVLFTGLGLSAGPRPGLAQASGGNVQRDIRYSAEFRLDIHVPDGAGPFRSVVLFHGASGVKSAMTPLAVELANNGYLVFNAEWLATVRPLDAASSLRSFEAAACALRFATARAEDYEGLAAPLTVVGLSAGGLGGAVVSFASEEFQGSCITPDATPEVDLFVGLEGVYVGATERGGFATAARELPALKTKLDPRSYLDQARDVRVVLFLGDQLAAAVPIAETFLTALQEAGIQAELRRVEGPHVASTFIQGVLKVLAEQNSR